MLALLVVMARDPAASAASSDPVAPAKALAAIKESDLRADLVALASNPLEGRDTPSLGLSRAAEHVIRRLTDAGFTGLGPEGSMLWPFHVKVWAPAPDDCALSVDDAPPFSFGRDFVPMPGASGRAHGETIFAGFGIDADKESYDDLSGLSLDGRVAVIVEGEPRHRRRFAGPEVTAAAGIYEKLEKLTQRGVAGVLVVQRLPVADADGMDGDPDPAAGLAFRHSWASWAHEAAADVRPIKIPVLFITGAVATELLGFDVPDVAAKIDVRGKPEKRRQPGASVTLAARSEIRQVEAHNVVARLEGSEPSLADEHVVIGAHYDHVGVDPRGRIGYGADDNASGTAALLEAAEALGAARPRRSILACAFAGEEDGLLGSRALCAAPPVTASSLVAMINLDMVGRGAADEVVAIGLLRNPGLDSLIDRALDVGATGVRRIVRRQGQELFSRSDQFSFHQIRVPTLFLFEGLPLTRNPDYHTWRDTIDAVDLAKVRNTARLTFSLVWLLATDDERPPPPEH